MQSAEIVDFSSGFNLDICPLKLHSLTDKVRVAVLEGLVDVRDRPDVIEDAIRWAKKMQDLGRVITERRSMGRFKERILDDFIEAGIYFEVLLAERKWEFDND